MIAALALVLISPQARAHEKLEQRLALWKPAKNWPNPPAKKLVANVNLEGEWYWATGMESAQLHFHRTGKDSYAVTFYAGGCTNRWTLQRTAKVSGGVIVLNRAVEEYAAYAYNRLYAVRKNGEPRLVSMPVYYREPAFYDLVGSMSFRKRASKNARGIVEPYPLKKKATSGTWH